jgi:hypothetical protein
MNRKKIFGIGAVVLMILVALAPAINSMQLNIEKEHDLQRKYENAGFGGWDLKTTFNEAVFDHYHETEDIIFWKITYTLENVGDTIYRGRPSAVLKVHNNDWEIASWEWPKSSALWLGKNEKETITIIKGIDFDNEIYLTGRVADLVTGLIDQHGNSDPNNINNIGYATGIFWNKIYSQGYIPNANHLEACSPHEQWIDHYETIEFPDENETIVPVPVFKGVYANVIIPRFLGSNRLGWLGKTVYLLIDVCRASLNFTADILEALAYMALLFGELFAGIIGVIALIESISSGNEVLGAAIVAALFLDLAAIVRTLEKLLEALLEFPLPGDPVWEELVRSVGEFLSYMSTYPWLDDITIFGEVNNCLDTEKVTISCRSVTDKTIYGGAGQRVIESFNVSSDFSLKLYKDTHLLLRNCQVTIKGSKHKTIQNRRMFSYVAPGGSLQVIAGFSPKTRSNNFSLYTILQRIIEKFPLIQQILSPYFFNQYAAEN